jgi:hypothetical protein
MIQSMNSKHGHHSQETIVITAKPTGNMRLVGMVKLYMH